MDDFVGAFVIFVIVAVLAMGMMFGFSIGTAHVIDDLQNYGRYVDEEHSFKVVKEGR